MASITAHESDRDRVNRFNREQSQSVREIGDIPAVGNLKRRRRAEKSYTYFCETYFPQAFVLPWSSYHHTAAAKLERAIADGSKFAFAMPRGSGKTTMCEWAVLWAVLTAKVEYALLIGATAGSAQTRLQGMKTELQNNELLLEDWPEVCYPIHALERSTTRSRMQTHNGRNTAMRWLKETIVLPTVHLERGEAFVSAKGKPVVAPTSGSIIGVAGLTGEIRGLNHKREDGSIIRPQLAVADDPQTRESAKSPTQCQDREAVIAGDVAYLAGPGSPTAVVMPCTVVYRDDMADKMLDRELHPEWKGERTRMVEKWPPGMVDNEKAGETAKKWEEYRDIQRNSFLNGGDGSEATAFYGEHREVMDDGFEVSWPERFDPSELSAIQHAMNKFFVDEAAFWSEFQNEPVAREEVTHLLTDEEIAAKQNAHPRGVVPAGMSKLTAFIDVGLHLLWWSVVAWEDDFGGQVLDYGSYPDQGASYFSGAKPRKTLGAASSGSGAEGAVYAGLDVLTRALCGQKWKREDGVQMQLDRLLIDSNYGPLTGTCYKICSASPHSSVLRPAHGVYVGASSTPWSEYKPKRGDKVGHHWREGPSASNVGQVRVLTDTNFWKSFVHQRLATSMGDKGSLSLFAGDHRMISEHMNAEYPVRTSGKGREVDEWKQRPDRPDNHFLDCMVGCAVAASLLGVSLRGVQSEGAPHQPHRTYTDLNALKQKRGKR